MVLELLVTVLALWPGEVIEFELRRLWLTMTGVPSLLSCITLPKVRFS